MTDETLSNVSVASEEEFEAVLAEAVKKAIEAGVDVRGAWEFQTNGSTHAWDVVIDELAKDVGFEEVGTTAEVEAEDD